MAVYLNERCLLGVSQQMSCEVLRQGFSEEAKALRLELVTQHCVVGLMEKLRCLIEVMR